MCFSTANLKKYGMSSSVLASGAISQARSRSCRPSPRPSCRTERNFRTKDCFFSGAEVPFKLLRKAFLYTHFWSSASLKSLLSPVDSAENSDAMMLPKASTQVL